MPIYEYECSACGHQIEVWQKIGEDPLKICPSCHKKKLSKVISSTTFHLKGSGWYVTDYAGKTPQGNKKTSDKESASSKTPSSDSGSAPNSSTKSST